MKPIKLFVLFVLMLAPSLASAQYYGGGGGYNGGGYGYDHFHNRMGRLTWGFSVGLGGMHDDGSGLTSCDNCATAAAFEADAHLGAMLTPRFALMFEGQINGRTVHADTTGLDGDTVLTQSTAMIAGQWWILPMLWVKGGIGLAGLDADNRYTDYNYGAGAALMGAVGFEVLSARFFAIDLQARIIDGIYNGGDDHVTAGTFGIGFNWY